ncbi:MULTISPECIES: regulatory protein RecX [Thalassotalea]|uniref:Regulatory protein RecX n=1 Tax=Thalassotalea castellviae TaxID=3075612 RepID=A0ABU3A0I6_9GAMM|nr:regulatory protein RecX [Thalassotalea sp. W431]MDT0603685.1 regulatory protein RecX [Thalassotalea sp. W431]
MNKAILHKGIDLLSRREHSELELRNKLRLREFQDSEITPVIDFLVENDYLNEARFADSVYRTRLNKGYGKRFIENELAQKGVSSRDINAAAQALEINWYHQVEVVYKKRFNHAPITEQKDKAKRIRFLQYRGFSTDEIFTVINEEEHNDG